MIQGPGCVDVLRQFIDALKQHDVTRTYSVPLEDFVSLSKIHDLQAGTELADQLFIRCVLDTTRNEVDFSLLANLFVVPYEQENEGPAKQLQVDVSEDKLTELKHELRWLSQKDKVDLLSLEMKAIFQLYDTGQINASKMTELLIAVGIEETPLYRKLKIKRPFSITYQEFILALNDVTEEFDVMEDLVYPADEACKAQLLGSPRFNTLHNKPKQLTKGIVLWDNANAERSASSYAHDTEPGKTLSSRERTSRTYGLIKKLDAGLLSVVEFRKQVIRAGVQINKAVATLLKKTKESGRVEFTEYVRAFNSPKHDLIWRHVQEQNLLVVDLRKPSNINTPVAQETSSTAGLIERKALDLTKLKSTNMLVVMKQGVKQEPFGNRLVGDKAFELDDSESVLPKADQHKPRDGELFVPRKGVGVYNPEKKTKSTSPLPGLLAWSSSPPAPPAPTTLVFPLQSSNSARMKYSHTLTSKVKLG